MYLGTRRGSIANLMPGLVGYLSAFAAYSSDDSFIEMLPHLSDFLDLHEKQTQLSLTDRIKAKRRKFRLP
jgi:hypothetical protein